MLLVDLLPSNHKIESVIEWVEVIMGATYHTTHITCMYQEDLLFNLLVWGSLRLTSNYVERESGLPPEVEVLADGLPLTPQHHKHSL